MTINLRKPVFVYRNIKHGRGTRPLYSVMQNGRVIRRTHRIMLINVRFIVREAGRQRYLRENRKNVHAFARGYITGSAMGTDRHGKLPVTITYNPNIAGHFWAHFSGQWRKHLATPVTNARCIILNEWGMTGAYTS